MKKKRGQMQLSFGMIFSIILIVIFISVAVFAIMKFLDIQNSVEVGKFGNDIQEDIDRLWKGSQGSETREYSLPTKITHVCCIDYNSEPKGEFNLIYEDLRQEFFEFENIFFYPIGSGEGLNSKEIKNIDLTKITESENPLCITNTDGEIRILIKKNFGESLVTVGRA